MAESDPATTSTTSSNAAAPTPSHSSVAAPLATSDMPVVSKNDVMFYCDTYRHASWKKPDGTQLEVKHYGIDVTDARLKNAINQHNQGPQAAKRNAPQKSQPSTKSGSSGAKQFEEFIDTIALTQIEIDLIKAALSSNNQIVLIDTFKPQ